MPFTFACPNPACTQVFSPQDVRGVTSLTCPKCGHVFRFGGATGAAPLAKPVATPVATPPQPAPPAVPLALPVEPDAEPEFFVPPSESRPPRRGAKRPADKPRGRPFRKAWLVPVVLAGLLVVLAVAGWIFHDRLGGTTPDAPPEVQSVRMNYAFRPPAAPWKEEEDLRQRLGAGLAMGRRDPNSWFGLVARDYKDRMPRDDEMLREAVARLEQLFNKTAQWEQKDDDAFAGLAAQRLVFTAQNSSNVAVVGECLMTAYNGVAYWFFGWTPADLDPSVVADVQQEWATIRDRFTLLKEREGWTGKVPEIVEAEGTKATYHLKYAKGLWENDDGRGDADLLLHGRDPDHPQDIRKGAWVRAFVLPATGDPESGLKAARDFIERREKKLYPEVKLNAVPDTAEGGLVDGKVELGQAPGQMVRLRVNEGENFEHFFAVAAVPRPAFTLVLVGECSWSQREAWEGRIGPVMHSLRFGKK
jgi:hypothetical protein